MGFLGGLLPPVSYVTRLDIYVMVGFAFLSAITVVHTILPFTRFTKSVMSALTLAPLTLPGGNEEDLIDTDSMCFIVFAISWGVWNVFFTLWLWISGNREYKEFYTKAQAQQKKFDESCQELARSSTLENLVDETPVVDKPGERSETSM